MFSAIRNACAKIFATHMSNRTARLGLRARLHVEQLDVRILPAVTYTWTGGAAENDHNCSSPMNWGGVLPTAEDDIVFNGAVSNKSATIDPAFRAQVRSLTVTGNYTETINVERVFTVDTLTLTQQANFARITIWADAQLMVQQSCDLTAGTIDGVAGSFGFSGWSTTMTIKGGKFGSALTVTFPMGHTTTVSVNGNFTIDGTTIVNHGTFLWQAGDIVSDVGGGDFTNLGTFQIACDKTLAPAGNFTLHNLGTLAKVDGYGTTTINAAIDNDSEEGGLPATINVNRGTLTFAGPNTFGGVLFVAQDAVININRGSTLLDGSMMTGFGIIAFNASVIVPANSSATASARIQLTPAGNLLGDGGGSFTTANSFEWTGGTIDGLEYFQNSGGMEIKGAADKELINTWFRNYGDAVWTDGGNLRMDSAAITNYGSFDVQNDGTIVRVVGSSIVNNGTFKKTAGSGQSVIQPPFTNNGQLLIDAFSMKFDGGLVQNQMNSLTRLNGGVLRVVGVYDVTAGTLSGPGVIDGDLSMNGNLDMGSNAGSLTITGNYTQTTNGRLKIKIGGLNAGQYDVLTIGGTATLAGVVDVMLVGGFMPAVGNTFKFLTATGGRTGTLAPPMMGWTVVPHPNDLDLVFQGP